MYSTQRGMSLSDGDADHDIIRFYLQPPYGINTMVGNLNKLD
jgi:hypothetical protein